MERCFSFSDTNNTVALLDERGCPIRRIISEFRYDTVMGTAEATLYSMFKFPESHRVHIQCDILVCPGTINLTQLECLPAILHNFDKC